MSEFTRKVFRVIAELWPTRQGKTLYSKAIYERLVTQGVIPKDGELRDSLVLICEQGNNKNSSKLVIWRV